MAMMCLACQRRKKTWKGQDPECAFSYGKFNSHNYMCASLLILRDWAEHRGIVSSTDLEEHACLIPINEAYNDIGAPDFLLLMWYKDRGKTHVCKLLTDQCEEYLVSLEGINAIVEEIQPTDIFKEEVELMER